MAQHFRLHRLFDKLVKLFIVFVLKTMNKELVDKLFSRTFRCKTPSVALYVSLGFFTMPDVERYCTRDCFTIVINNNPTVSPYKYPRWDFQYFTIRQFFPYQSLRNYCWILVRSFSREASQPDAFSDFHEDHVGFNSIFYFTSKYSRSAKFGVDTYTSSYQIVSQKQ